MFAVLVGISRTASRRATARRQTISSHTRCHDVLQSECQKQGPGPGRSSQYIQQCAVASDASATLDPNSALFLRRLERPRRIRDNPPPLAGERGGRAGGTRRGPHTGGTLPEACFYPVSLYGSRAYIFFLILALFQRQLAIGYYQYTSKYHLRLTLYL